MSSDNARYVCQPDTLIIPHFQTKVKYVSTFWSNSQGRFFLPTLKHWDSKTDNSLEKDHPEASTLQAFRYQIAQVYWKQRYRDEISYTWVPTHVDETKKWLNKVIEKTGDNDSFYSDLAERRLKNLEPR